MTTSCSGPLQSGPPKAHTGKDTLKGFSAPSSGLPNSPTPYLDMEPSKGYVYIKTFLTMAMIGTDSFPESPPTSKSANSNLG